MQIRSLLCIIAISFFGHSYWALEMAIDVLELTTHEPYYLKNNWKQIQKFNSLHNPGSGSCAVFMLYTCINSS